MTDLTSRVRSGLGSLVRALPVRVAIGGLDAVGAATLAHRQAEHRIGDEVVSFAVPPADNAFRSRHLRMRLVGGTDLVVRTIGDGGWRSFEPPLPDAVLAVLREWPETMFDVGANTGLYALIGAAAHPDVTVHAFEPVPDIVAFARDNFELNWPMARRIRLHSNAVGDDDTSMQLHLPPPQADGTIETSASLEATFKEQHHEALTVDVKRLDTVWSELGRPATSLVKVDVEGAEHRVVAGATALIETCRPILAVEILERSETEVFEALRTDADYVPVTLSPWEAVVNRPVIEPEAIAPNQLLVPWERLDALVARLRQRRGFVVTLLP